MSARTALITGAGQGIGAATAWKLASDGWRIAAADFRPGASARLVDELDGAHVVAGGHIALTADITDERELGGVVDVLRGREVRLGGLVNGAGVISRQPAEEFDAVQWERQLGVHLTGAMRCAQAMFPLLCEADGGAIVNVASVGSTFGLPGRLAYATAKSGVVGLTRTLAVEWGRRGIRVNAIAPGYVRTEMVESGLRSGVLSEDALRARTPLGRLAEPAEIAAVIAFLLSAEASFIDGAVVKVDGGLTVDGTF